MVTFLFLTVVFGIVAIHPFTTYPLSLWCLRKLRSAPPKLSATHQSPSVAICVCAYNAAGSIEKKLANLRELADAYPGEVAVYIYNDGSDDGTGEILQAYADVFEIVDGGGRSGKSVGMNTLLSRCREELVVFSDANVQIDLNALAVFARHFESPKVGCVCGTLHYLDSDDEVAAQTSSLYWKLEEFVKQLESDTGSVMGADGSLFAIRRELFRDVPHDIIDDMFTSISILCDGYEVKRAADAVAYERAAQKSSEEFRRKKRIACRCINCCRLLATRLSKLSWLNAYKFFSHKLLRWTSIVWMVASVLCFAIFLSSAFGAVNASVVVVASLFVLCLGHFANVKGFRHLTEMIGSFVAVGIGVVQSFCGMRYQTWQPAISAHHATGQNEEPTVVSS